MHLLSKWIFSIYIFQYESLLFYLKNKRPRPYNVGHPGRVFCLFFTFRIALISLTMDSTTWWMHIGGMTGVQIPCAFQTSFSTSGFSGPCEFCVPLYRYHQLVRVTASKLLRQYRQLRLLCKQMECSDITSWIWMWSSLLSCSKQQSDTENIVTDYLSLLYTSYTGLK